MILDGKLVSNKIKEDLKIKLFSLPIKLKLVVILVGDDPASQIYVRSKQRACKEVGALSEVITLPSDVSEKALIKEIEKLNNDNSVHGILVQLPLPKHISESVVINSIDDMKDVDGFHMLNKGRLLNNMEGLVPATPLGVMELLKYYEIDVSGKNALVIGRSNIVGKPMAALLLNNNATVTIAHSHTKHLTQLTQQADIIVVGVGQVNLLTVDMVKENSIIIDVGINRVDGKVIGDVDFANVSKKAFAITPVPGGVGPMTIAMLLSNLYTCYKLQSKVI